MVILAAGSLDKVAVGCCALEGGGTTAGFSVWKFASCAEDVNIKITSQEQTREVPKATVVARWMRTGVTILRRDRDFFSLPLCSRLFP
jgi:hypothetical protein